MSSLDCLDLRCFITARVRIPCASPSTCEKIFKFVSSQWLQFGAADLWHEYLVLILAKVWYKYTRVSCSFSPGQYVTLSVALCSRIDDEHLSPSLFPKTFRPIGSYISFPPIWPSLDNEVLLDKALSSSLQGALSILHKVQELPTCNKLAAAALIHSCATLESPLVESDDGTSTPTSDSLVDESKKLFAARLAVCELHDAKITVPQECQSFLPAYRASKQWKFRGLFIKDAPGNSHVSYQEYEQLSEQNLDSCLSALHSYGAGQGWTSYSNNKKNAVAMCHAVRSDLEKDEQINLFKILLNSTIGVEGALSRSKQEWDQLKSDFKELKSGMRQLFVDLHDQDTERQVAAAALWVEVKRQMQEGVDEVLLNVDHLQQDIIISGDGIGSLSQRMESLVKENTEQWGSATASLTNAITLAQELVQQKVMQALHDASEGAIRTNELVMTSHQQLVQYFAQYADSADTVNAMRPMLASIEEVMLTIHGEQIQRHLELQAYANKTQLTLEKVNTEAERLLSWVKFFGGLFEDWLGVVIPYISASAVFCAVCIITTMVAFVIWRSILPIGFFATCCIAFATGLATSSPLTSVISSRDVSIISVQVLRPTIKGSGRYFGGMMSAIVMMQVFRRVRDCLQSRKIQSFAARGDFETRLLVPKESRNFSLPVNNPRHVRMALEKSFERSGQVWKR
nr:hypothetical protein CFP56_53642 [Quercus suber]